MQTQLMQKTDSVKELEEQIDALTEEMEKV